MRSNMPRIGFFWLESSQITVQVLNKNRFSYPSLTRARLRRRMATQTYRHAMTTAFKNWHSLAVGAVLLALSVFLTSTAFASLKPAQTPLQGWTMLVSAG